MKLNTKCGLVKTDWKDQLTINAYSFEVKYSTGVCLSTYFCPYNTLAY